MRGHYSSVRSPRHDQFLVGGESSLLADFWKRGGMGPGEARAGAARLGGSTAPGDSAGLRPELEGDGLAVRLVGRRGHRRLRHPAWRKRAHGGKPEHPGEEAFSRWIVAHGLSAGGWDRSRKKGAAFGL